MSRSMRDLVKWSFIRIIIFTLLFNSFSFLGFVTLTSAASISDGPYYVEDVPDIGFTKPDELKLGYVDSLKVVQDALEVLIPRLPSNTKGYGGIETNVEVTRLDENHRPTGDVIKGTAIAFSNLDYNADAGYVFVHPAEVDKWIQALNGNPNWVLSHVTTYEIKNKATKNLIYRAYNLAEIAYHSGGRGNTQGDGLKKSGSVHIKYDYFEATPRPNQLKIVASSSPSGTPTKTSFKANETIYLQGTAKDYSFYDQGINPVNIAIVNNKTGGEYQSASGASSLSKSPPLTAGIDIYKGTFVATDKHGRSVQGSSDYSASKPAEILISVEQGVCTAISGTLKVSGQADKTLSNGGTETLPSGKNTITLVFPQSGTLKVDGASRGTGTTFASLLIDDSTVIEFTPANATYCTWTKTFSSLGGGGGDGEDPGQNECDDILDVETMTGSGKGEIKTRMPSDPDTAYKLAYDTDTITLEADEAGEFRIGNRVLQSNTGLAITLYSGTHFPTDGSIFTLSYRSADGKECWVKKFYVGKRDTGEYECPWFTAAKGWDGTLSNGETIPKGLNGTLWIRAWFAPPGGDADHVPVYWRVTAPDGTVTNYKIDTNDDDREALFPTDLLQIEGFKKVGTYTITYFYDKMAGNDPYKSWKEMGCPWTIYVNVSACENTDVQVKDNGKGYFENYDPETGEYLVRLSKNVSSHALSFTSKFLGDNTNASWVLKSVNSATPLKTATNTDTFDYTINEVGEYLLTVTFKIGNETCVKTYRIFFGENCDDLGIVAKINNQKADVTGNGTKADPFVVYMPAGQDNRFSLTLTLDGEVMDDDYEWTLYRNDVYQYRFEGTYFSHTIPNGSAIYSVKVEELIDNINCERWIVFRVGEPPDPEQPPVDPELRCQDVYMHLLSEQKNYLDVAPAPEHTGSASLTATTSTLDRFAVLMSDGPTATGNNIDVKWETSLVNQAPSEFANSLFIGEDTPAGRYTIKATVNEPGNPNINGCVFVLTITISTEGTPPSEGGPGGPVDGGQMNIRIYDSTNRLLASTADGVWEKEPARIEVTIDQGKIDNAFSRINTEINKAIEAKKEEYEIKYEGEAYEDVQVQINPAQWNAKTNPATVWPTAFAMKVEGPGIDQSYQLQPKLQTQSKTYTGTIAPTITTWNMTLLADDYRVTTEDFTITAPYRIDFEVSYSKCEKKESEGGEEGEEDEKTCTPGTESGTLTGTYTILVKGDQTQFEVYEPNAKGYLDHTAEWKEYHSRDRYPASKENDFYAGERILIRVQFDAKHRHPFSNRYPDIVAANGWISETGQRSVLLQSTLALQEASSTLWKGPSHQVQKLGTREKGVDTTLMGDKQQGFKKGSSYAVYFNVQFAFGVSKGFMFANKQTGTGHEQADYRVPFTIIANAWERQGIRNHTSH
ncbi:MAG TPA: hypothetical protein VE710_07445 [Candidatus Bathyarchaeia archaeon]|nr:hypothetical protein [Candidatus Bathyarchaeia archaeon]